MKFLIAIVIPLILSCANNAQAQNVGFGSQLVMPIDAETGEGLGLGIINGANVLVPLGSGWLFFAEAGVFTSFAKFQPAPQILVGFGYKFNKSFAVFLNGLYRWTPDYEGGPETDLHTNAVLLAPAFPISKRFTLALPIGPAFVEPIGKVLITFNVRMNVTLF